MWWKIAVGAAVGAVVGAFVPPGYALWIVVGVVGGYLAETLTQRARAKASSSQ